MRPLTFLLVSQTTPDTPTPSGVNAAGGLKGVCVHMCVRACIHVCLRDYVCVCV